MIRFLTFRGVGHPAEFVTVTVALVALVPVILCTGASMAPNQNPQAVRVLGNVIALAALFGSPWVWVAALCRHVRWLQNRNDPRGRTLHGDAHWWCQLLTFRGVGRPAEFVTVTVALAVLLPVVVWIVVNMGAVDQNPLGVRVFGNIVGWVAFFGYPWVGVAALCRHIRWLNSLKGRP